MTYLKVFRVDEHFKHLHLFLYDIVLNLFPLALFSVYFQVFFLITRLFFIVILGVQKKWITARIEISHYHAPPTHSSKFLFVFCFVLLCVCLCVLPVVVKIGHIILSVSKN